jgi:hypothetical protein
MPTFRKSVVVLLVCLLVLVSGTCTRNHFTVNLVKSDPQGASIYDVTLPKGVDGDTGIQLTSDRCLVIEGSEPFTAQVGARSVDSHSKAAQQFAARILLGHSFSPPGPCKDEFTYVKGHEPSDGRPDLFTLLLRLNEPAKADSTNLRVTVFVCNEVIYCQPSVSRPAS